MINNEYSLQQQKINVFDKMDTFLDLKSDEVYFFSYSYDLEQINFILKSNINFYGSGELMNYSRIFVNDALVSFDYESSYTLYGIVIKITKDNLNTFFEYENTQKIQSKSIELYIKCELYNELTNNVKLYTLKSTTFMKIGSNEDLKLKKIPTINQMLNIRKMLNSRHKINKYISPTRLYIKGYNYFQFENNE